MRKTRIVVVGLALLAGLAFGSQAFADAPNGNSGHNSNGDTQCQQSDSNPNCPPVGK